MVRQTFIKILREMNVNEETIEDYDEDNYEYEETGEDTNEEE